MLSSNDAVAMYVDGFSAVTLHALQRNIVITDAWRDFDFERKVEMAHRQLQTDIEKSRKSIK